MTAAHDDPIAQRRFAFRIVPMCAWRDNAWRAWYPGTEWAVTGPSEEEARQNLAEEIAKRRNVGEDPTPFGEAVYRQHLLSPIEGVYAMDNNLYRYLVRELGYNQEALQAVFEESERRRASGGTLTKDDYLAWRRETANLPPPPPQRGGQGRTVGIPLKWERAGEGEHASRGRSHYVVSRRPDGQWVMTLFSMYTDVPGQAEEKLGDYLAPTPEDAKALAQGLADQTP